MQRCHLVANHRQLPEDEDGPSRGMRDDTHTDKHKMMAAEDKRGRQRLGMRGEDCLALITSPAATQHAAQRGKMGGQC